MSRYASDRYANGNGGSTSLQPSGSDRHNGGGSTRFDSSYNNVNASEQRYSAGGERYGAGGDRYGTSDRYGGDRYNGDRYGGGDRNSGASGNRFGNGGSFSNGDVGSRLNEIQWDLSKLPVFEKNFYIEHPAVRNRSEEEAEQWRRSKNITVIGKGIPKVCNPR